jgi:hypothetical protein
MPDVEVTVYADATSADQVTAVRKRDNPDPACRSTPICRGGRSRWQQTKSTTPAAGRAGTPHWAVPAAILALFILMAALLVIAVLIPVPARPGPGPLPRPQPAPSPVQPR